MARFAAFLAHRVQFARSTAMRKGQHMKAERRNAMMMLALVVLCTGTAAAARGVTIAHEGFQYSAATADTVSLGGKNGGTGWASAWSAAPVVAGAGSGAYIDAKDMTYPGLASTGLAAKIGRSGWAQAGGNDDGGIASRQLDLARVNPALLSNGQLGAPCTTIWVAFTASAGNWFGANPGNKIGLSLTSGGQERLSIGANAGSQSPGAWVLTPNLGNTAGETSIAAAGPQVRLFVVRIVFADGDEQVTVWHNPAITAAGPSGGTQLVDASFPGFTFDGIALRSNRTDGVPVFDELRVGTDFASVVGNIPTVAGGTIADETFDSPYTAEGANPLNGAAGGAGWAAPWSSAPSVAGCGAGAYIDTRDMGYPGLVSLGNAARLGRKGWAQAGCNDGGATATRPIDRSRVHPSLLAQGRLGANGTTLWLAFTGFASNWLDANSGNKIGLSLTRGATEVLSIGANGGSQPVGSWVLTPNLGTAAGETQILPHGSAVHLFVVKIEFQAGAEKVTVWGDPDIRGNAPVGGTQAVNAAFPDFTFDGVKLQSNRNDAVPAFDNLRIGTSFASVAHQRALLIVAHQDDDLLFMSPDLARSLQQGHVVQTVYVTDGEGNTPHCMNYVIGREDGVMTAYAQMAGEPNIWSCGDVLAAGKPVRRCALNDRVSLAFLRLPASVGGAVLSSLWSTPGYTVTDWNTGATYSRQDVIQVLTALMADFAPTRVSTGESGGVYGYDHPEHDISALFALEAHHAYASEHHFARYRGYSSASEPQNLTALVAGAKETTFRWYAACDKYMCSTASCGQEIGCIPDGYSAYYSRQYLNKGLEPGAWRLRNAGANACLSAGPSLTAAACSTASQQTWTLNNAHQLVSADGRCLRANGTAVVLEPCAPVSGQRWTPLDNGLILGTSGLCLALSGGAVQVSKCSLTSTQLWAFGAP